jgi:DNA ligase (NAD+)
MCAHNRIAYMSCVTHFRIGKEIARRPHGAAAGARHSRISSRRQHPQGEAQHAHRGLNPRREETSGRSGRWSSRSNGTVRHLAAQRTQPPTNASTRTHRIECGRSRNAGTPPARPRATRALGITGLTGPVTESGHQQFIGRVDLVMQAGVDADATYLVTVIDKRQDRVAPPALRHQRWRLGLVVLGSGQSETSDRIRMLSLMTSASPAEILTRSDFDAAVASARSAAQSYYDTGDVLMTDADYDVLLERISTAKQAHPEWDDHGLTGQVAAGASAGGDVRHAVAMLSLDKVTSIEAVEAFAASLGGDPCTVEVKLDGLALRVEYRDGKLTLAALRGDGTSGENVTAQVLRGVAGLPARLDTPWTGEVRGETYMTLSDFETSSANRVAAGGKAFVNSRGAVAGAIRSVDRTYDTPMTFAAYDIAGDGVGARTSHQERMGYARSLGFPTAGDLIDGVPHVCATAAEAVATIERIGELRRTLTFPIDGAVLAADLDATRQRLGTGSRTPYWAAAFKYPADTGSTVLRDIEVRVGRTGRIALRAVLDPVFVDGTTITYATLHNPKFVQDQGLAIGQTVAVWRAGDVIPRVTAPIGEQPHGLTPWTPPEACPQCGGEWDRSSLLWRCHTPSCALTNRIAYAASRDCLDVDGLGEEIIVAMVEAGLVRDLADLFGLPVEQIAALRSSDGNRQVGSPRSAMSSIGSPGTASP